MSSSHPCLICWIFHPCPCHLWTSGSLDLAIPMHHYLFISGSALQNCSHSLMSTVLLFRNSRTCWKDCKIWREKKNRVNVLDLFLFQRMLSELSVCDSFLFQISNICNFWLSIPISVYVLCSLIIFSCLFSLDYVYNFDW